MSTNQTQETVLRVRELSKFFGKGDARLQVLNNVSFDVQRGDLLAITGKSGSGKTTLLNIMGSLDTKYSGDVQIFSSHSRALVSLRGMSDSALSRMRNSSIGFIFQHFNLLSHLTCLENVMMPATMGKTRTKDAAARALQLMERLAIAEKVKAFPSELSGGQKQRVAIARAMFNEPSIILCDEPTGALDSATSMDLIKLFHEINAERRASFIIVTHDTTVSDSCKKMIRLGDGCIVETRGFACK
ncbi:MAG: ABC transporter ATP-binding protein [Bradymonadales bacterium]